MKRLLITLISHACVTMSCFSQQSILPSKLFTELPIDGTTKKVTVSEVLTADALPLAQLRGKIKDWQKVRNNETSRTSRNLLTRKIRKRFRSMKIWMASLTYASFT